MAMVSHPALLLMVLKFCSWALAVGFETQPSKRILSFEFKKFQRDGQDYHDDLTKTAKLDTVDGNSEQLNLTRRQSLLSPTTKLEVCSNGCEQKEVPDVNTCIYKGKVVDDPDSTVSVVGCDGDDVNFNIVSTKKDFGNTAFRKTKSGQIETMKKPFNVDQYFSVVNNKEEGEDYSEENCCRVKLKFCLMERKGVRKCLFRLSRQICGDWCGYLESKLLNSGKKGETKHEKTEEHPSHFEDLQEESEDDWSMEEYESDSESVTSEEESEADVLPETPSVLPKRVKDVNIQDLKAIEDFSRNRQKQTEATKDSSETRFRGMTIFNSGREKSTKNAPRIYDKKTLEIGVVVSPLFYNIVKMQLGQKSEEDIIKKILTSVQEMFADAETYLLHSSISKTGGFTIVLNGIKILKDYQEEEARPLEGLTNNAKVYYKFAEYAEAWNHDWDGDKASHDLMLILNGQDQSGQRHYFSSSGIACVDCACNLNAAGVVMVPLADGKQHMAMGKLIAHEIGHILGASHDTAREPIKNAYSVFGEGNTSPCLESTYLMNPSVGAQTNGWSVCSQKDIDNGENDRKNCYYT